MARYRLALCHCVFTLVGFFSCEGQALQWSWWGGDTAVNDTGSFRNLGRDDGLSRPQARYKAFSYLDAQGRFTLYGGNSRNDYIFLANEFKYNPTTSRWLWSAGIKQQVTVPNPGPAGVRGPYYYPTVIGFDYAAASQGHQPDTAIWSLRLPNSAYQDSEHEQLWRLSTNNGQWARIFAQNRIYPKHGPRGVETDSAYPGRVGTSTIWIGAHGKMYLFAGSEDGIRRRVGITYEIGARNSTWRYNPATGTWCWLTGTDHLFTSAYFGPQARIVRMGAPDTGNVPPAIAPTATWQTADRALWMYFQQTPDRSYRLTDTVQVWRFDPLREAWAPMVAGRRFNDSIQDPIIRGYYNATRSPVLGRFNPIIGIINKPLSTWVDTVGRLWLFLPRAYSETGANQPSGLWCFDTHLLRWAFIDSLRPGKPQLVRGPYRQGGSSYFPGGRVGTSAWCDQSTNALFLFAGYIPDTVNGQQLYPLPIRADVWRYGIDERLIDRHVLPVARMAATLADTVCPGALISILANTSIAADTSYLSSAGLRVDASRHMIANLPGTWPVWQVARNRFGKDSTLLGTLHVRDSALHASVVFISGANSLCPGRDTVRVRLQGMNTIRGYEWDHADTTLVTGPELSITDTGVYIGYTLGYCGWVSDTVRVGLAGCSVSIKPSKKNTLSAVPNPTTGKVHLQGLRTGDPIYIYSVDGRLVGTAIPKNDGTSEVDLTTLGVGLFLVRQGKRSVVVIVDR